MIWGSQVVQPDREIQNALSGYNKGLCAPDFFYIMRPVLLPVKNAQKFKENTFRKVIQFYYDLQR